MKLRFWDTKEKKMIYAESKFMNVIDLRLFTGYFDLVYGFKLVGNCTKEYHIGNNINEWREFEKRFVVLRFTGLQDTKKNDIYEGDLVRVAGIGDMEVIYRYGQPTLIKGKEIYSFYNDLECDIEDVVGNVYEKSLMELEKLKKLKDCENNKLLYEKIEPMKCLICGEMSKFGCLRKIYIYDKKGEPIAVEGREFICDKHSIEYR